MEHKVFEVVMIPLNFTDLVTLQLILDGCWEDFCRIEMCALEDNEVCREVIESKTFEPVIYLRCSNATDMLACKIRERLEQNVPIYGRLKGTTPLLEALHFDVFQIREIYRCLKRTSEPNRFVPKWMITGLSVSSAPPQSLHIDANADP